MVGVFETNAPTHLLVINLYCDESDFDDLIDCKYLIFKQLDNQGFHKHFALTTILRQHN